MKYRTKLYVSLIGVSFISCFLGIGIVYQETKKSLFDELRSTEISIISTIAPFIDGDQVKTIAIEKNDKSAAYLYLRDLLRKVRDVNRRQNLYVDGIYALTPSPTNPSELIYIGDADENPDYVGELYTYEDAPMVILNQNKSFANNKFITDQWGIWLSSFAPIRDSQGKYVASIGLDVNAKIILSRLHQLLNFGFFALGISVLFAIGVAYFLSRFASRSLSCIYQCVNEIGKGNLASEVHLSTKDEFNDLAEAINTMTKGLQERERLKLNFARYVSHQVLEKILKSESQAKLEGERKKITVLFTDIRQFSHLTEKMLAEDVVSLLNEYFDKMFDVILSNTGTLDKFVGDSIMVEFGAPLDDPLQEDHALETAIKMQKELKILCEKWEKEGKPSLEMGIGIHTGLAVVGNIGSEKRMEYTAIGDTVNVASRLEHATKILKKSILVSESTAKGLSGQFKLENLGPITLPGREETINIYAIET